MEVVGPRLAIRILGLKGRNRLESMDVLYICQIGVCLKEREGLRSLDVEVQHISSLMHANRFPGV